ncbi:MAG: TetR/AcrR family transcriptional repressor of nem operon [Phenylobacterium sp.]|jgi:TetR/AcrR family transcriptional repressor of nem operon
MTITIFTKYGIEVTIPPGKTRVSSSMSVTTRKEQTRQRIIAATVEGIKEHGYGGIGVDGIAKKAGVTSGAFYGHFSSKNKVFEAAVSAGVMGLVEGVIYWRDTEGEQWLYPFIDWYLGNDHRNNISGGCALPGLSADVARADQAVHLAYEQQMVEAASIIAASLNDPDEAQKQKTAWALLSTLAGGVIVSRAMDNQVLADEISLATGQAAKALVG